MSSLGDKVIPRLIIVIFGNTYTTVLPSCNYILYQCNLFLLLNVLVCMVFPVNQCIKLGVGYTDNGVKNTKSKSSNVSCQLF